MISEYYVIVEDFNGRKFVKYDVIPYLTLQYNKSKNKPKTFEEFKEFIAKESLYKWWSRCEYEIVISSWPPTDKDVKEKIDVHSQILMNIDIVTFILMNNVNAN